MLNNLRHYAGDTSTTYFSDDPDAQSQSLYRINSNQEMKYISIEKECKFRSMAPEALTPRSTFSETGTFNEYEDDLL